MMRSGSITWRVKSGFYTSDETIETAFSSLERNHSILARMNFTCCQTCGIDEISGDQDEDSRGYVFFHKQDTEGVTLNGEDLCLAFGSFKKSEKRNRAVGEVIVRSLKRGGLRVEWEGNMGRRITVHREEWRRRIGEDEEVEDVSDEDFNSEFLSSGEKSIVSTKWREESQGL
ncbi:hypothetical protein BJX63DRAFT_425737 [Aspergillus granulosus]|uniref:DUF6891 domain-containing protein n=1 Tax=Aspergillus granulosus TaxID=176169 RepID=A0ABR4GWE7_9EURO